MLPYLDAIINPVVTLSFPLKGKERLMQTPADFLGGCLHFMKLNEAIIKFEEYYKLRVKQGTIRGYSLDLRRLCLYLHNPLIEEIRDEHIINYMNEMLEYGWNQNTLMPKSMAFRKFFQYWSLKGYRVLNYQLIPVMQRDFVMPHVADKWEYDKIMEYFSSDATESHLIRNRAITGLIYDTGIRVGEAVSLNVEDIDLEKKTAVIKTEKSRGKAPVRQIFWEESTNEDLKKWLAVREKISGYVHFSEPDALFVGVRCWQIGKRLTNSAVGIFLRHASRKVGLKRVMNAHSLRHLKGNDMAEANTDGLIISQILGHSQVASSRIYTLLKSPVLGEVARKINQARPSLGSLAQA
ncbi:MAG: tyrosine-type recombinase/integrase [Bacteroidia bacterium]